MNIATWLREALEAAGATKIDTGSGMGAADVWFTVDGREYHAQVKLSNAELARRGAN